MLRKCEKFLFYIVLLPPANEVWGKVIFLHQFVILFTGGHAWLLWWGGCVVAWEGVWLLGGACVVAPGGVHGFIRGACMVLFGGHAWFYWGGMHGFIWGGVRDFFSFFGYNEIRSMSGRYTSYWNAFLFKDLIAHGVLDYLNESGGFQLVPDVYHHLPVLLFS